MGQLMRSDALLLAGLAAASPPPPPISVERGASSAGARRRGEVGEKRQGVTLLGIVTPELRLSTTGAEDLNQVGPFVLHSRSRWEGEKLITEWNSSSFQGQSFRGSWTRRLSADGRQMILEIAATSGTGTYSHAQLVFRRE